MTHTYQVAPLPFLAPLTKVHYKVTVVVGPVRYKHVILGALGVKSVTLLRDHDCVLRVVVQKNT